MGEPLSSTDTINFQTLRISRDTYGANKGKLSAKIDVSFSDTALSVELPDDIVSTIMEKCAPYIAASIHKSLLDVARAGEAYLLAQQPEDAKLIGDDTVTDDDNKAPF